MKKLFYRLILILFSILISLIIILSTTGLETDRFNEIISQKINESNNKISIKLEKIKYKFDIQNLSLFLKTSNPEFNYQDISLSIKEIKIYSDLFALIKSEVRIKNIKIASKEIPISQLKKLIIKTKPSNLNSFITNKIYNGLLIFNLDLDFDSNQEVENFIVKGEVKEMDANIYKDFTIKNTSFNFFADSTDILIKKIQSDTEGFVIKEGNIQIKNNEEISIKSDFNSEININKKNASKYLPLFMKNNFLNSQTNLSAKLNHYFQINFDKTFKVTNYTYTNKGKINALNLKLNKPITNQFLNQDIKTIYLKDTDLSGKYTSNKKNNINIKGIYSLDGQNFNNFDLNNIFLNDNSKINLDFEVIQKININLLNYKKDFKKKAKILVNFQKKKDLININQFSYTEGKSSISIEKIKIRKKKLISLKKLQVKTFSKNILKNDFNIKFEKKIKIFGNKYDAENLNELFKKKSENNILEKINKEVEIDLQNIETPLSKKLSNFKLIGVIEKGKFIKIISKGDFGNDKYLDISMKSDKKNKKKYLEIYSDLPQPLLSNYSFFSGLSGGILTFTSLIEEKRSSSKLIIEKFKVVNAPGVIKLLSLADFGGLADLAEGEGLSFEKMEVQMTEDKGLLKLDELYAVGPSISVLMDGYKEKSGLTSLRGTLIPAKNLNKFLAKIPLIGKIIIPKEVGEGLFGVSFKMKGKPGEIKTSINPIKTLTPRFITKALERSRKSK